MVYSMQRYQLYLNPAMVAVFDEGEKLLGVTRSALVRQALERAAEQMVAFLSRAVAHTSTIHTQNALDALIGRITVPGRCTDFARRVDETVYATPNVS